MTESMQPEQATIQEPLSVDDNATTLSVDDGAGSLTVDGTVAVSGTVAVTDNAGSLTVDDGGTALQVQQATASNLNARVVGFTAHDAAASSTNPVLVGGYASAAAPTAVSLDGDMVHLWADLNGRLAIWDGASTISIDDGAGSLTVDGTVAVSSVAGSVAVTNGALSVVGGGVEATALRVTLASDSTGVLSVDDNGTTLSIDDGAGSITVDDGGTALQVQQATASNLNARVLGFTSHDASAASTNPLVIGGYASTAPPTAVSAAGDAVRQWNDLNGRLAAFLSPVTEGGLSVYHLVSAATTNATNIKASAGQVYGWYIYNSNAAARKVAFHNSATAPTAGASVFFSIVIPPTSGANVEFTNGIAFSAGIGITTVTDLTDAGATAVAANDLIINIIYK